MKRLGFVKDGAHIRKKWRSLTTENRPELPQCGNEGVVLYGLQSHDVEVVVLVKLKLKEFTNFKIN